MRRDWSFAEVLRRAAEAYLLTIADEDKDETTDWKLPILKPSGGLIRDPADVHAEVDSVVERLRVQE